MNKLTVRDWEIKNKTVVLRVDYNVSFDKEGNIIDDTRIRFTLPTLNYLLEKNCKIVIISHLGRPKGKIEPSLSLRGVAPLLAKLLNQKVDFVTDCIGKTVEESVKRLKNRGILLLENLRFHPEEEKNDLEFAQKLASFGDVFVQDAFGTVHRSHASTVGIPKFLPTVAGLLLEKEISYLSDTIENAAHPFLAIIGGDKVENKIEIIKNLLNKVDALIIGGGMAYTFLKSYDIEIGNSLWEPDKLDLAEEILCLAKKMNVRLFLPLDHIIADKIDPAANIRESEDIDIPAGWIGVDIGPLTIDRCAPIIKQAKTIFWNGPMGIFEIDKFAQGSIRIAQLLAQATERGAITIAGGGATVTVAIKAKITDKVSHLSTGGGACLEFLEGKQLPGLMVIPEK